MANIRILLAILAVSVLSGCSSATDVSATSDYSASKDSRLFGITTNIGYYCMPNLCHLLFENTSDAPIEIEGNICGVIDGALFEGDNYISVVLNPGGRGQADFGFAGSYRGERLTKVYVGDCLDEGSAKLIWMNPMDRVNETLGGVSDAESDSIESQEQELLTVEEYVQLLSDWVGGLTPQGTVGFAPSDGDCNNPTCGLLFVELEATEFPGEFEYLDVQARDALTGKTVSVESFTADLYFQDTGFSVEFYAEGVTGQDFADINLDFSWSYDGEIYDLGSVLVEVPYLYLD